MFRLYSKGCEYAIRALAHVSQSPQNVRFQAKTICEKAGIPESFTRKVFQALVQADFLEAARGPGGGYALTKDPNVISLLEVIQAVDGEETFEGCIMGLEECNAEKPCPLHAVWTNAKGGLMNQLEARTLMDLIDTVRKRAESQDAGDDDLIHLMVTSPD